MAMTARERSARCPAKIPLSRRRRLTAGTAPRNDLVLRRHCAIAGQHLLQLRTGRGSRTLLKSEVTLECSPPPAAETAPPRTQHSAARAARRAHAAPLRAPAQCAAPRRPTRRGPRRARPKPARARTPAGAPPPSARAGAPREAAERAAAPWAALWAATAAVPFARIARRPRREKAREKLRSRGGRFTPRKKTALHS